MPSTSHSYLQSIEEINENTDNIQEDVIGDSDVSGNINQGTSPDYQPKKKFRSRTKIQQISATARELKTLSDSLFKSKSSEENHFDIYGKNVASQLKLLSPQQAITAEMEINNILTKCRFADYYASSPTTDHPLMATSPSNISSDTQTQQQDESSQHLTTLQPALSETYTFHQSINFDNMQFNNV